MRSNKLLVATILSVAVSLVHALPSQEFAVNKILSNASMPDAEKGAVVASPSRHNPDYYYHWIRDAALTYDALLTYYEHANNVKLKHIIQQKMYDYRNFSVRLQHTQTLTGLGEPKFNVDGRAYNGEWGRPQNDGPALRAISFIHWANILLQEGQDKYVRDALYDAKLPADLPIKVDLEYISHHWQEASYDIWEEVKGTHFYTLMVTRKALLDGAMLANKLNDHGAAVWYQSQATLIEKQLTLFWDKNKNLIKPTINQTGGMTDKKSDIDTAVILGLLHGDRHDGFLRWSDAHLLETLSKQISAFKSLYPINHVTNIQGVAIGRYPEDHYSGSDKWQGNPWVLCTYAVAEALYRHATELKSAGDVRVAASIAAYADQFIKRVDYHANADGSLSEQIDKDTGFMQSAYDLTWNYAAILTLYESIRNY